MQKYKTILGLLALGALLLAACAPVEQADGDADGEDTAASPADDTGEDDGDDTGEDDGDGRAADGEVRELRVRAYTDLETMDPALYTRLPNRAIAMNIYSGLLRYEPATGELVGDLAEDWEVSDDGLEYVFHLREGVQWHGDYGEFTAADVKYSYERIMDPETQAVRAFEFDQVDEIVVEDDYTVRILLSEPNPVFPHAVSALRPGFIVNEQAVEDAGDDFGTHSNIGTGPFVFESWTPREELVLTANPDYFLGPPELDRIVFVYIPDDTVAHLALESGEIDVILLRDSDQYRSWQDRDDITINVVVGSNVRQLRIMQNVEPLDDVRVRHAIQHAVDLEQMDLAFEGIASSCETVSPVPPNAFGYTDDVVHYDHDPDRARGLLEEAGLPDGFQTELWALSTEPWAGLANILQAQLGEVGIEIDLRLMDGTALVAGMQEGSAPLGLWGPDAPPDADYFLYSLYHSSQVPPGVNTIHYENPEVDQLLEEARGTTDEDAREAAYHEALRLMSEDSPAKCLVYNNPVDAMGSHVRDLETDVFNGYWLYPVSIEH